MENDSLNEGLFIATQATEVNPNGTDSAILFLIETPIAELNKPKVVTALSSLQQSQQFMTELL